MTTGRGKPLPWPVTVADQGRSLIAAGCVLVAIAAIAYVPASRGGYIWDDDVYVTKNQTLRSTDGLRQIWIDTDATPQYYPLTFTTLWAEYQLWGLSPAGYHLTNIALHAGNAILLWVVLCRLSVPGAYLAAAIFALHPVHVESVAWITERKNVLSVMFFLLSLLAWLRFVDTHRWRSYVLAFFLFACALASKTVVCTFPLVVLLLAWWRQPTTWRRQLPWVLPFLALSVAALVQTAWREGLDDPIAGVAQPLSMLERGLVASRALWFYAWKLAWPVQLMTIYPRWEVDTTTLWPYLFPAASVLVVTLLWWARKRLGRGPLVAILFFAITLSPSLGFVSFNFLKLSHVADHFQYLASIGLIALFAATVSQFSDRLRPGGQQVVAVLAAVMLLALGGRTWQQGWIYEDAETLWRDNIRRSSQAWWAHHNLAFELANRGELGQAVHHFEESIRISPTRAEIHNNLAVVFLKLEQLDKAHLNLSEAVRLRPDYAPAQYNLGVVLVRLGEPERAIPHLAEAIRLHPDFADAHNWWGGALEMQGKLDEALEHYEAALALDPNLADARANRDRILSRR